MTSPVNPNFEHEAMSSLNAEFEELRETLRLPGLGAALWTPEKQASAYVGHLSQGGSYLLTKKARFATVCLVKFLTSLVVLKFAEESRLSLDAPVGEYLPELAMKASEGGKLRVRHLLSHTSGLRGSPIPDMLNRIGNSWEACAELIQTAPRLFLPGKIFNEDSLGHIVLGQIIFRITGKTPLGIITEHILAPLGIVPGDCIKDSDFPEIHVQGHVFSSSSKQLDIFKDEKARRPNDLTAASISALTMTAEDLMRIAQAINLGLRNQDSVISPFVAQALCAEAIRLPTTWSAAGKDNWSLCSFGHGAGIFSNGMMGYFAAGRGQSCSVVFGGGKKLSIGLGLNLLGRPRSVVLDKLMLIAGEEPQIGPPAQNHDILNISFEEFLAPFDITQLVGRYTGSMPQDFSVVAKPGSLGIILGNDLKYMFSKLPGGKTMLQATNALSTGFFPSPESGEPCMMVGMQTYKKI